MEKNIKEVYTNEISVDKSIFITYFFPCSSIDDFNNNLSKIKKEHNKAKHYCYAYKINSISKSSDDGEPSGSAGKPILNVIEHNNLNNVGIIVVRYFGGVLLGAGRLLRTYSLSASEVVKNSKLYDLVEMKLYKVVIDIDLLEKFKNYLSKKYFNIKNINFNDKIELEFYSSLNFNEDLESVFYPKLRIEKIDIVKCLKES